MDDARGKDEGRKVKSDTQSVRVRKEPTERSGSMHGVTVGVSSPGEKDTAVA